MNSSEWSTCSCTTSPYSDTGDIQPSSSFSSHPLIYSPPPLLPPFPPSHPPLILLSFSSSPEDPWPPRLTSQNLRPSNVHIKPVIRFVTVTLNLLNKYKTPCLTNTKHTNNLYFVKYTIQLYCTTKSPYTMHLK